MNPICKRLYKAKIDPTLKHIEVNFDFDDSSFSELMQNLSKSINVDFQEAFDNMAESIEQFQFTVGRGSNKPNSDLVDAFKYSLQSTPKTATQARQQSQNIIKRQKYKRSFNNGRS